MKNNRKNNNINIKNMIKNKRDPPPVPKVFQILLRKANLNNVPI
jgi:hypothetical protein